MGFKAVYSLSGSIEEISLRLLTKWVRKRGINSKIGRAMHERERALFQVQGGVGEGGG